MATVSESLAAFAAGLRFEDLPRDVVRAAKRHILDALGVAPGAAANGAGVQAVDMVRSWAGAREASVVGFDVAVPAPAAALANGVLAHALDFDDTHVESAVHASAFVVPTALADAEEAEASGRNLLAAAAAGRLWDLSAEQIAHALGIAGSQSSGLFAHLADGSETKRLHAGWAAHGGIVAADLARRGFTGPRTVFEGPNGFCDAFLAGEDADLGRAARGLGAEWETARIAIKPYPACHFLHAFMDAVARARVRWGDVEEIVCMIAPAAIGIVAEPREPRLHPAGTYAAQFSLPFAVASALVGGRQSIDLFGEEARADRRVLTLAERVRHVPDPTLPFPRTYGGRLLVHTRGGRTIEIEELVNRGHPDRPLTVS